VAVTTTGYLPGRVPGSGGSLLLLPPPPQAERVRSPATIKDSSVLTRRRLDGTPSNSMPAKASPLVVLKRTLSFDWRKSCITAMSLAVMRFAYGIPREELSGRWRFPKIKKRPVTLSSHGTPEQPSPRTAQSQGMFSLFGCKFHVGATGWHEMAMTPPGRIPAAPPVPKHRIFNDFQEWIAVASQLIPGYRRNLPEGYND
jgi:hypothetical protein